MAAASVSRARLLSTSSCSTTPAEQLDAGLPLPRADEDGAADLVEHRGRALLGDGSMTSPPRRRWPAAPPPVEPQLAGVVGRRDGRGVGHIEGRQARTVMTRRAAGVSLARRSRASTTGWLTARNAPPAGSPKFRASL